MIFANSIEEVSQLLSFKNAVVLCDQNTANLCYPLLDTALPKIVIPSGEEYKTLESCNLIWDGLIRLGSGRASTLVCLGGGMISDIGAFAASCFQRGVHFVLIPTSLLAMVDAAVGGKCGIDYKHLKNYVGLFAEAEEIIICTDFLQSLPNTEWRNGKIEMLKHGLIADKQHFIELSNFPVHITDKIDQKLIERSIAIKLEHTHADYKELGIRKRLNFGHSIGHAIESLALQKRINVPHGLAVGVGMLAESFLSFNYWSLNSDELFEIETYFKPLLLEIPRELLNSDELMPFLRKDKKNNKQIYLVRLNHIGSAQENIQTTEEQLIESIDYLLSHYD